MAKTRHEDRVDADAGVVKYGALSQPEGKLSVTRWLYGPDEGRQMMLVWREPEGPKIESPPERRGFGSRLIEHTLAFEPEGEAMLDFAPDGLGVRVELPLKNFVPQDNPLALPIFAHRIPLSPQGDVFILKGKRILVVEDEHLVAHETVVALTNAGCEVIGPLPNVPAALGWASGSAPDAAILDFNPGNDLVWPVALLLRARRIPFVFVTGCAALVDVPEALQDVLRLEKPLRSDCIVQRLADQFDGSQAVPTGASRPSGS